MKVRIVSKRESATNHLRS